MSCALEEHKLCTPSGGLVTTVLIPWYAQIVECDGEYYHLNDGRYEQTPCIVAKPTAKTQIANMGIGASK